MSDRTEIDFLREELKKHKQALYKVVVFFEKEAYYRQDLMIEAKNRLLTTLSEIETSEVGEKFPIKFPEPKQ